MKQSLNIVVVIVSESECQSQSDSTEQMVGLLLMMMIDDGKGIYNINTPSQEYDGE